MLILEVSHYRLPLCTECLVLVKGLDRHQGRTNKLPRPSPSYLCGVVVVCLFVFEWLGKNYKASGS